MRIAEIDKNLAYSGYVRVNHKVMEDMGLIDGNRIKVCGKRETGTLVAFIQPDLQKQVIEMDEIGRYNIGTNIGEFVQVEPLSTKIADRVILIPIDTTVFFDYVHVHVIKECILRRPLRRGEMVGVKSRENPSKDYSEFGLELSNDFMQGIRFMVVATIPSGFIEVGKSTMIEILKMDNIQDYLGKNCVICGKLVGDLSFRCKYCQKVFCWDHRFPKDHGCKTRERIWG